MSEMKFRNLDEARAWVAGASMAPYADARLQAVGGDKFLEEYRKRAGEMGRGENALAVDLLRKWLHDTEHWTIKSECRRDTIALLARIDVEGTR